ncbi:MULTISPECIES: MFS transporter [Burkholderiales]|uniref:MFS transporter n=2 Tax=Burkholderiales TaxID=80840 RepID=A0A4P7LJT4_9BURK|nr:MULTISPECIES: MFS transporter [Burkholderiales]AFK33047.1 2,4-D transport protein [Variovorax sp. DB1]QBY56524.1 MFS transporter [Cupriavidus oxalaticus]
MKNTTIDITEVIEKQAPNRTVVMLLALSFLIMLCDGYDLQAIAFASPTIIASWGIEKASFGFIFSAGLLGVMLGGFLFGYLADRIGRRPAFLLGTFIFSAFTLAAVLATNVTELAALRFFAGLGIGGITPICFALNVEYVPKRFHASVVGFVMIGYVIGISVGGLFAAWLVPVFGWQVLFYIGGFAPLVLLPLLAIALPESIKYLVLAGRGADTIARIVNAIDPSAHANAQTRFVLEAEEDRAKVGGWKDSVKSLFSGRLSRITPVLWLAFIANSVTVFFLASWIPVLTVGTGRPATLAAIGLTLFSAGGAFGGLFSSRLIDRFGVGAMGAVPLLAAVFVVAVGSMALSDTAFLSMLFIVGFFVLGGHVGLMGSMGLFYANANRANGVGWAISIGKLGSIIGPAIAGILIAADASISTLFIVAAAPLLVAGAGVVALGRLQKASDLERAAMPAGPVADPLVS